MIYSKKFNWYLKSRVNYTTFFVPLDFMMWSDLNLQTLQSKLNFQKIPGWKAQQVMAPPYRQNLVDEARFNTQKSKIAAVLIILCEINDEIYFPVIHRNTYPGIHSNQVGFPGGKVEKSDENLEQTAIRESFEEIGAKPEAIEIWGELTELFIPPSNFIVHPFVGSYKLNPNFIPCDKEVKDIIFLSLKEFILNPPLQNYTVNVKGKAHKVPGFNLNQNLNVWGATAMMLNEFLEFIRNSLNLNAEIV
ncbi:Putative NUDIX hydrolase [Candidatus Ornithobacterium hominis]|nr:Putative NUDIX hydrolase [Candidatus Ornithobacterium hominis]